GGLVELWRGDLKRRLRTLQGPVTAGVQRIGFSQDGTLVLGQLGDRLRVWETDTGRLRGVLLLSEENGSLTIKPEAQYASNQQVERSIVMVVRKDDGTQEVLESIDFEKKYGLKNNLDRVHLLQPLPPALSPEPGQPMGPKALVREPAELP